MPSSLRIPSRIGGFFTPFAESAALRAATAACAYSPRFAFRTLSMPAISPIRLASPAVVASTRTWPPDRFAYACASRRVPNRRDPTAYVRTGPRAATSRPRVTRCSPTTRARRRSSDAISSASRRSRCTALAEARCANSYRLTSRGSRPDTATRRSRAALTSACAARRAAGVFTASSRERASRSTLRPAASSRPCSSTETCRPPRCSTIGTVNRDLCAASGDATTPALTFSTSARVSRRPCSMPAAAIFSACASTFGLERSGRTSQAADGLPWTSAECRCRSSSCTAS